MHKILHPQVMTIENIIIVNNYVFHKVQASLKNKKCIGLFKIEKCTFLSYVDICVYYRWGAPGRLLSDQGREFCATVSY